MCLINLYRHLQRLRQSLDLARKQNHEIQSTTEITNYIAAIACEKAAKVKGEKKSEQQGY